MTVYIIVGKIGNTENTTHSYNANDDHILKKQSGSSVNIVNLQQGMTSLTAVKNILL